MSAVDGMLQMLAETNAKGLRLAAGAPARILDASGATQEASSQPLTRQEILQLIGPIVPEHARRRLPQESSVEFDYVSPSGPFKVTILRNGSEIAVSFAPDVEAAALPPPPVAPPALPLIPPPPPDATPAPSASSSRVVPAMAGNPIDRLFRLMIDARASDLHLSAGMPPLIRKDGQIQLLEADADALSSDDIGALLDPIMPQVNRDEFSRRHDTDFTYDLKRVARFRGNVFLDRKGRCAVFRVVPAKLTTAEDLGLSPYILRLCQLQKGLVIVAGPTGSGKSTTLSAMIDYINRTRTDHIITVEDPIEFVHENKGCLINQREVGTHTVAFRDALRAAVREDPDIILVGELRDAETTALALATAESGHLVLASLQTPTVLATIDRMIDQFPPDQQGQIRMLLSENLKGAIAQSLCRQVGGGRIAALEVLLINTAIANLIREGKTFQVPSMMNVGRPQGMVTLNDALMDLVARNVVEPEEAYVKSVDKAGFEGLLKQKNIDTKFIAAVAQ